LDQPNEDVVKASMESLEMLEAIDEKGDLTEIGKLMTIIDTEPGITKSLICGIKF